MTKELGEHTYFPIHKEIATNGSWFATVGIQLIRAFEIYLTRPDDMPSLVTYRKLVAHELATASHPTYFWRDYSGDNPKPTKQDRLDMVSYLKFMASHTGLLHSKEIQKIVDGPFETFTKFFNEDKNNKELPTRIELKQKIIKWKKKGYYIIGFQGSFDFPTEKHLLNATDAIILAQEQGLKFKIIFILDNDELIQRKASSGKIKPRFNLEKRRSVLEPFWQVAGTCTSSVTSEEDWWSYVLEYHELGLDHIMITTKKNPTLEDNILLLKRSIVVRGAKKKILWIQELSSLSSSTDLMKRIS